MTATRRSGTSLCCERENIEAFVQKLSCCYFFDDVTRAFLRKLTKTNWTKNRVSFRLSNLGHVQYSAVPVQCSALKNHSFIKSIRFVNHFRNSIRFDQILRNTFSTRLVCFTQRGGKRNVIYDRLSLNVIRTRIVGTKGISIKSGNDFKVSCIGIIDCPRLPLITKCRFNGPSSRRNTSPTVQNVRSSIKRSNHPIHVTLSIVVVDMYTTKHYGVP